MIVVIPKDMEGNVIMDGENKIIMQDTAFDSSNLFNFSRPKGLGPKPVEPAKKLKCWAFLHIFIGMLCIAIDIVAYLFDMYLCTIHVGAWAGIIFMLPGLLMFITLCAKKNAQVCPLNTALTFSVLAAIVAGIGIVFSVISIAVDFSRYSECKNMPNYYSQLLITAFPSIGNCTLNTQIPIKEFDAVTLSVWLSIGFVSLLFYIFELWNAINTAEVSCLSTCTCCMDLSKEKTRPAILATSIPDLDPKFAPPHFINVSARCNECSVWQDLNADLD